ncbi:hypothetical protein ACRALDRAFT_1059687 [Sodiomyces alcalophilus JCM 7366]|uniref:uncharacterized protein n=1 Tax=Sodiomyces alcalophilus JCM 7366 TaxID=591952 RepID=UPI0039B46A84
MPRNERSSIVLPASEDQMLPGKFSDEKHTEDSSMSDVSDPSCDVRPLRSNQRRRLGEVQRHAFM